MIIDRPAQLAAVHFDAAGLVPVIAQDAGSGEVLMLAYANREALTRTLETRRMCYFSRSRQQLWEKGETSGHTQHLVDLHLDCDADALIARVHSAGPACHTGARNCFGAAPTLRELADVVAARDQTRPAGSYTVRLLSDRNLRLKKLGEEAVELALACQSGGANVAAEAADLLYHMLVATHAAGVNLEDILLELERRFNAAGGAQSTDGTREAEGTPPESPGPATRG
ncbi:MAG TPA: bifunctional phosphoribosyl-AMP cyclohydrolase/phosphoribosyl-ATP diphosphatase HisIE [Longimicrobiales bacterium]|nr:bifunctional phosphoribosyl-AMP cyclohydrolase/phosphoribosyl-ATP diphosphatase HisIE [Longimicrobiales bacterium]